MSRGLGVALAALLLIPEGAAAGAWNRERSGFYVKAGYGYLQATELATPDGEIADIPPFTKHEAGLYVEYGLRERLTALADLMLYRRSAIEEFESAAGIGDVRLGLQWQLARRGAWVWAARGVIQAPTGDATRGSALLPTGSGAWEGELWLGVGTSLWQGRGWAQAELGHQARGEGLRDGLVYSAQLGYRPANRLALVANLRGIQPYDTAPSDLSTNSPVGFGDGVTYLTWGLGAILELGGGAGLQAEVDFPAHVRNIAKGPTFRLGVFVSR